MSDNYFEVIGVRPRLGPLLASHDDGSMNRAPEAVLSHRFWESRLRADPPVVGQTIWLSGVSFTIVGVAPPAFKGTSGLSILVPDLWVPLGMMPQLSAGGQEIFQNRSARSLGLIGRLKSGVSLQAQAALGAIAANLERAYPESNPTRA